jgi:hypothetical protein
MSLLLIAGLCLIALQFTSAIGQWISENQKATQVVGWLQWLVSKIGLAPTIITTRVVVILAFVVLYELQLHWLVWAVFAAAAWYLYKTGSYVKLWYDLTTEASSVVNQVTDDVTTDVTKTVVTDVTKNLMVDPKEAQAAMAAGAKGVDVSRMG